MYNLVGFQTNLKFGEQKRVFGLIPALKNAEFVRYGVMHRNTFINSPKLLTNVFSVRDNPNLFFAGQVTGVEGYMESGASGLIAGINAARTYNNAPLLKLPEYTMIGALANYISDEMIRDDSSIDLYGRPYYGIDISGESFDYQKIMSIQDTSNTCNDVMRITSIVMICAVASPILSLCGAPAAGGGNCDSRGVECFAIVYGVIIGIALVIGYLINFVVCIIIYISIQRLKWILVDNSNIGDEFTNEMFKLLLDNYSSNYNYALGIIIVIAIMFASGIISLILHCLTKM